MLVGNIIGNDISSSFTLLLVPLFLRLRKVPNIFLTTGLSKFMTSLRLRIKTCVLSAGINIRPVLYYNKSDMCFIPDKKKSTIYAI